jgi:alkanesulfonate monooxygenase SsuD/methylene tetrahydromethanopterin reductase-like flavin-dependent oxidoreductase (luciferase family)
MGAGWHKPEFDAFGLPFDHRVARLEESVTALKALLHGERVTRAGRFYQFRDAELLPRPPGPPPIWIAAFGERMLRFTAHRADGWNFAWCGGDPEPFRRALANLRRLCAEVGRDPDAIEVSAGVLTMPLDEGADLRQAFAQLQQVAPQWRGQTLEQFRARVLAGPPDEILAGLRRLIAAGARHLLISVAPAPLARYDPTAIERIGALLPALREM